MVKKVRFKHFKEKELHSGFPLELKKWCMENGYHSIVAGAGICTIFKYSPSALIAISHNEDVIDFLGLKIFKDPKLKPNEFYANKDLTYSIFSDYSEIIKKFNNLWE